MDTTLKQRLIGAVVLVALAVIFLPMLVQGPAPDSGVADVSTRVPDAPGGEYETRELPMLGAAPGTQPDPVQAEPDPARAEPAAEPARPDPAVAAGRWAVSFGAYASNRDADAVLSRLRQAGLPGFSEQTTLNGRQAWRVRVGPYEDRALAEAGRLQAVRIRNDVNAQVIALDAGQAESPAPASTAAVTTPTTAPAASTPVPAASAPTVETTPLRTEPQPAPRTATTASTAPPARPAAAPAEPPRPAAPKPAANAPAAATTPAAASVGFAVQMGAFASTAEANALRDRLRGAGFSAIVQPVRTDKGTLNRVRVGPVASRAEAEQLKTRLAGNFGGGMVVSHP